MKTPIYLDYAATTPCDPLVANALAKYLTLDGNFANPASRSHFYGWQAEAAVEKARKQVATLLNADTREIVWTSGATEANNLAIKGAALARIERGKHIVSSLAEHKAVIDSVCFLEKQGFEISWVKPEKTGEVSASAIKKVLRPDTILISTMHVNNETGAISDIEEIASLAKSKDVLFHVDAAQSVGKLTIDTTKIQADMISMCAHKIYGPKGIGLMYVRNGSRWMPWLTGGSQEQRRRGGTTNVPGVIGFAKALEIATRSMEQQLKTYHELNQHLLSVAHHW